MEPQEALVAGIIGLGALYSWQRQRDPVDRWLALGVLWICITGIVSFLLASLEEPFNYIHLALRLSGPPVLLLVAEESVRSPSKRAERKTSLVFAGVVWLAAVGALIYYEGGPLGNTNLQMGNLSFGLTAWMAILGLSFLAALLTIIPAALQGRSPGLAGIAAMLLLTSETLAAIDSRWNTGALPFVHAVTYRSLLSLSLAFLAVLKAFKPYRLLRSVAGESSPSPSRASGGRTAGKKRRSTRERDGSTSAASEVDESGGPAAPEGSTEGEAPETRKGEKKTDAGSSRGAKKGREGQRSGAGRGKKAKKKGKGRR